MVRVSKAGASLSRALLLAASIAFAACTSTAPVAEPAAAPSITSVIDAAIDRPPFDRAFWSILVEDDDGTVLYSRNADKLTIPASNRKLFSASTVASCLGPDARLATELWMDGDDLILRGDGDPSLGSWRYERTEDFDHLAQLLVERGITRVRDLVADVSLFDRETIPESWKYGNLEADYGAPVDALAWGENEIAGNRATANAALNAANALRDALFARGVEMTGTVRVNTEPREWQQRIAVLPSPFIWHLLTTQMQNSHNLYAEMLLKRLGVPAPASYEAALARERAFLTTEVGLPQDSFSFVDGSGLSPEDLVTPQATIRVLRWMNEPARRSFWWAVLAQPNNNGTLHHRVVSLEERMRGKTGTINGVNALSGIIAMPDGRFRYFSAVVNHHIGDGDDAMRILDEIALRVAE